MRCPTLAQLPPPPPGKTGWPWTEESSPLPPTTPSGSPWPRVSIVTPSFNQGPFLEETIRSVLLQGYPDLEYLIVDGGSSDGSLDIIRKYQSFLASWVSEPDRGHPHAVNKGWARATGDILAFLNSDDLYTMNAVSRSVAFLDEHPDIGVVYASAVVCDEQGKTLSKLAGPSFTLRRLLQRDIIPQPTAFLRRSIFEAGGPLDESYFYWLDYAYWLRLTSIGKFGRLDACTAVMRLHHSSKTGSRLWQSQGEFVRIFDEFLDHHPGWRPDRPPMRRTYLQGLLYAAGSQSNVTLEARAHALQRLQRVRPEPSIAEITYFVASNDAAMSSIKRTDRNALMEEPRPEAVDTCGIVSSLLDAGILTPQIGRRILQRAALHTALRQARHTGDLSIRGLANVCIQAARTDSTMLFTRGWWSEVARSFAWGQSVVEEYRVWREVPRSLVDRLSASVLERLSRHDVRRGL